MGYILLPHWKKSPNGGVFAAMENDPLSSGERAE
jgi:hypothetical protein